MMEVKDLKNAYLHSVVIPGTADRLLKEQEDEQWPEDGVFYAYMAMLEALTSRDSGNPMSQLQHYKRADKLFNKAVELDKENPEIRLLRFGMHNNAPGFLRDQAKLLEDKRIVMDKLKDLPQAFHDKELLAGQLKQVRDSFFSDNKDKEQLDEVLAQLEVGTK